MISSAKELAVFCKKKGFIYPSSEIYGGVGGLYDYGHLGAALKRRFENLWRRYFLGLDDNFVEIDAANIMHENVFKASGHLENFIDPVAIGEDGSFERADHLLEKSLGGRYEGLSADEMMDLFEKHHVKISSTGAKVVEVKEMNMMFPIIMGVGSNESKTGAKNKAYLRPETAQSPYVNFKLQYELLRKKLPMGLALVGKAYRNEISPRNMTLRLREFTQAELQIFFNPGKIKEHPHFNEIEDYPLRVMLVKDRKQNIIVERTCKQMLDEGLPKFYVYHLAKVQQFYLQDMKVPKDKLRLYQLSDREKAFYNKYHFDVEAELSEYGYTEIGGIHYRTDHDLLGHQEVSGEKMEILDEESGEKFIPHVLELSFGVDRNVYLLLDHNHDDDKERGNVVLHLLGKLTPYFCAVFPLVKNKDEITVKAREVLHLLKEQESFAVLYDESGSVGRRYARADEIGIRYCVTIDFESLDDRSVTIRDRENTQQERVKISELKEKLLGLYAK